MCTSQHGITLRNSSLYLRYFYSRGPTNVKIVHCTVRCLLLETKFHQLVPSSSPFMIQQMVLYTKKTVKKKNTIYCISCKSYSCGQSKEINKYMSFQFVTTYKKKLSKRYCQQLSHISNGCLRAVCSLSVFL